MRKLSRFGAIALLTSTVGIAGIGASAATGDTSGNSSPNHPATAAQFASMKKEIEALKEQVIALQQSLSNMQTTLAQLQSTLHNQPAIPNPAPGNTTGSVANPPGTTPGGPLPTVSLAGAPVLGSPDAKLTIVEFSDFQCPYCGQFYRMTFPTLYRDYIMTGKVRLVIREFPLSIHENAQKAAEAADCAGDQNKFWQMYSQLYANQNDLSGAALTKYAQQAGADPSVFQSCLDSGKFTDAVVRDHTQGQQEGVRSIPTFMIGYTELISSKMDVQQMITGAKPIDAFKQVLDPMLARN